MKMSKKHKYSIRDSIKELDLDKVKKYIVDHPKAKIYFGCDSTKFKKKGTWYARYITAIVVYEPNKNKIFGDVSYERDFDQDPSRPAMRMLQETYKVSAIVVELQDLLKDRYFEVHLDINTSILHGSNVAMAQAIGYIKGVNGISPVLKPDAWAASCVADHLLKR